MLNIIRKSMFLYFLFLNKIYNPNKYAIEYSVKESLIKSIDFEYDDIFKNDNLDEIAEYFAAIHESGHAIAAYYLTNSSTRFYVVNCITIIPNEINAGYTYSTLFKEHGDNDVNDNIAEIIYSLAGIIAQNSFKHLIDDIFIDYLYKKAPNLSPESYFGRLLKVINMTLPNLTEKDLNYFNINKEDTEEIKRKKMFTKLIKDDKEVLKLLFYIPINIDNLYEGIYYEALRAKPRDDLYKALKNIDIVLQNLDEKLLLNEFKINKEDTKEIKRKKILAKFIDYTQNLIEEHKKEHEILTNILFKKKELIFDEKFTFENLMKAIKDCLKNHK